MAEKKISSDLRLLQAAELELIENDGRLEMLSVARRAGLATGLAYHYFGSKAGLVAGVVDRFYGPLREIALGTAIPTSKSWAEREKTRVKTLIDYFYDHNLAPLIAGRLSREPEVLDVENAHMDALLETGARNIAQGQKLGVVNPRLDPAITVALLMGGLRQAINSAVTSPTRPSRKSLLTNIWKLTEGALQLVPTESKSRNTQRQGAQP